MDEGALFEVRLIGLVEAPMSLRFMAAALSGLDTRSHPHPHPEVLERSGNLEGGLQIPQCPLEASFEAADAAPQNEGVGGTTEVTRKRMTVA